jgi:hypothetical protein
MRLYWLRDDQWERIKDLLPGKVSDRGVTGWPEPAPLGVICPIAMVTGTESTSAMTDGHVKVSGWH